MNRKLHNTLFAFSATAVMLVTGLMVASPAMREAAPEPALVRMVDVGPLEIRIQSPHPHTEAALERSIEAKALAFETKLEQTNSAAEIIAHTIDFSAQVAAEAAIAGAFADASADDAAAKAKVESDPEPASQPRRRNTRAREALALPFFSFAQGLRRGNRS